MESEGRGQMQEMVVVVSDSVSDTVPATVLGGDGGGQCVISATVLVAGRRCSWCWRRWW